MDTLDEMLARAAAARTALDELEEDADEDLVEEPAAPPPPFPPKRVHFTQLSKMSRSPAHYRAAVLEPFQSTPAMRFGAAVHGLILGNAGVVRYDGGKRQGRAWIAFATEHRGKIILTAPEHDRATAIARKVKSHPLAAPLLEGEKEIALEWEWQGRACGGRLDVLGPKRLVEVKTTPNASLEWFPRHAGRMGYHAQLVWYREGARSLGYDVERLFIIAVEIKPPYAVTVFWLNAEDEEAGARSVRAWMERFLACEQAESWPEYAQTMVPLGVPQPDVELRFEGDDDESEAA